VKKFRIFGMTLPMYSTAPWQFLNDKASARKESSDEPGYSCEQL
jgi:hypothetical protein